MNNIIADPLHLPTDIMSIRVNNIRSNENHQANGKTTQSSEARHHKGGAQVGMTGRGGFRAFLSVVIAAAAAAAAVTVTVAVAVAATAVAAAGA